MSTHHIATLHMGLPREDMGLPKDFVAVLVTLWLWRRMEEEQKRLGAMDLARVCVSGRYVLVTMCVEVSMRVGVCV